MKKIITLLLLIICACGAKAQIITTIVGGGTTLGDGGPAVDCELSGPYGITIGSNGNRYIVDRGNNRIRMVNTAGIITTIAGTGVRGYNGDSIPATDAELNDPAGITTDASGEVYFCDRGNNRVRKIDATGIITTIAGNGNSGFSGDGGPATAAEFNGVGFIKLDVIGNIYLTDPFNNRIRMVSTDGMLHTIAGSGAMVDSGDGGAATAAGLRAPHGIDLDGMGNIYFVEYYGNIVRKINALGIITTVAGNDTVGNRGDGGPATKAELHFPVDIVLGSDGSFYVSDAENGEVRKVTPDGQINTIAGNGHYGFSGDGGDPTLAEFAGPTGLAIDQSGSLYISDNSNDRIRYIRNTVGVQQIERPTPTINIYPNPSNGSFKLNVTSAINEPVSIIIADKYGRIIQELSAMPNEETRLQMNVPTGIYVIKSIIEGIAVSRKIVVQ